MAGARCTFGERARSGYCAMLPAMPRGAVFRPRRYWCLAMPVAMTRQEPGGDDHAEGPTL